MNIRRYARYVIAALVVAAASACTETHFIKPDAASIARHLDSGDYITVHFADGRRIDAEYKNVTASELITRKARYPLSSIRKISYETEDPNVENFFKNAPVVVPIGKMTR